VQGFAREEVVGLGKLGRSVPAPNDSAHRRGAEGREAREHACSLCGLRAWIGYTIMFIVYSLATGLISMHVRFLTRRLRLHRCYVCASRRGDGLDPPTSSSRTSECAFALCWRGESATSELFDRSDCPPALHEQKEAQQLPAVANNTYCGGTWKDLENDLESVRNMGFDSCRSCWDSLIIAHAGLATGMEIAPRGTSG
jgi:hypothetical protein